MVSTFLIFMFVDHLSLVHVFSKLYYSNFSQKTTTKAGFRYKLLKSWEIDNIDFTQQFSLSIFTDFRSPIIKKHFNWYRLVIDWLLRDV